MATEVDAERGAVVRAQQVIAHGLSALSRQVEVHSCRAAAVGVAVQLNSPGLGRVIDQGVQHRLRGGIQARSAEGEGHACLARYRGDPRADGQGLGRNDRAGRHPATPIMLCETEIGAKQVRRVLQALECGGVV